ncbi:MAG: YraN family protein [Ruminococcaceae bacterium]|nr:YraN family protein [Oscillospiraceae bacterium]
MGQNNLTGAWGETQAAEYLRKKKYKLLAAGYRCRFGEIDLIAANRKYLIFVEVKTRKDLCFALAREFVDLRKQARIRSTAEMYLVQNPTCLQPRFDVIEVYAPQGIETKDPVINHLEGAFE